MFTHKLLVCNDLCILRNKLDWSQYLCGLLVDGLNYDNGKILCLSQNTSSFQAMQGASWKYLNESVPEPPRLKQCRVLPRATYKNLSPDSLILKQ